MTLRLSDVHRSLGLFAEGLAGHTVRIEARDEQHTGWPWDLSLPDPAVVELPPEAALADGDHQQRLMFRAQVLHQLAMVEFGTFGPVPTAPDPLAVQHHRLVIESPNPAAAAALATMLEHLRVVWETRRRYPGATDETSRALSLGRSALLQALSAVAGPHGIAAAVQILCLDGTIDEVVTACDAVDIGTARWLHDQIGPLADARATLDDSAHIAATIVSELLGEPPQRFYDGEPLVSMGDDPDAESPGEGEELEFEGSNLSTPPLDVEADSQSDDLQGLVQSAPISISAEIEQLQAATNPTPSSAAFVAKPADIGDHDRTYLYDEWDHLARAYKPSWCRVVERRVEGDDHDFAGQVRRRHADLGRRIRRQFGLLRPEDRLRVYKRDDGDELDLDAAIEAIVDRRTGVAVDDRVNIRRDRVAREVATAFLIDLSASTSAPTVEPEPYVASDEDDDDFVLNPYFVADTPDTDPVRRVIDVAKDAVALMCDALDQLGDQHAVYGFSGNGRLDVEFRVGKEFDERASVHTWAALAGLEPIRYTRMGPAVRHAAAKLAAVQARTRLLFVISDGYPQDIDYGPTRGDKTYGLHDTAKAVEEASAMGVDTFCVTIDPAGHDYLRVMFPARRYMVIGDVESLPDELAKLYMTVAGPTVRSRTALS
ncbi:MAG: hypothetical protein R2770_02075 [Acidimicrobiales bacterium]